MFDLNYFLKEDSFSAICSTGVNSLYVGTSQGFLAVLDVRQKKFTDHISIHDKKINTIDFNQNSSLIVTSSTDATAKVWDVRKLDEGLNISTIKHRKAVHSAQFSPSGSTIATCRFVFPSLILS
jgi:WD40 repeat protein